MEFINRQNPWWFFENWESKDRDLRKWNSMKIRWIPSWLNEISLEPFSLNFVYGPRQVGKTTGIKLLIKRLIEKGVEPKRILYLNLESIASLREFRRILFRYLEIRNTERLEESYIFLDEITSVSRWYNFLKFMVDQGYFENDVLTATGSSSVGILRIPERFPGRRGKGRDIEVLPLSFPEFVEVLGYSYKEVLYDDSLRMGIWEKYKEVGGFPSSINGLETAMEDVINGLISEIAKHGLSVEIAQMIISSVLQKIPSSMSFNSIAGDIGVSHKSVREYVEFLKDVYLWGIAYLKEGNKISFRREKKIFFRDPFLIRSMSYWNSVTPSPSAIIENIVQEHLYRKFGEIYYYRNSYEIDAIAGDLKVEIKTIGAHRRYPKDVIILTEEGIPEFLIKLFKRDL